MVRHTINIPDDTNEQVKAVLGGRSIDDFAAEALRRHAYREHAVRKLLSEVEDAQASGQYDGTLSDLTADMDDVIQKTQAEQNKA